MATSDYFELSKENPFKLFEFGSADFKLNIISVTLMVDTKIEWQRLISKLQIRVQIFGQDFEYSCFIHLNNDSYRKLPLFEINKLIDKKVFENDIHTETLSNVNVKIEIIEVNTINESFALGFNYT